MQGIRGLLRLTIVGLLLVATFASIGVQPVPSEAQSRHETPTLLSSSSLSVGVRSGVPKFAYLYWTAKAEVGSYEIEYRLDGSLIETKTKPGTDGGLGQYVMLEERAGRWCARVRAAAEGSILASPWTAEVCSDIAMPLAPHPTPQFDADGLQIATSAGAPYKVHARWPIAPAVEFYEAEISLDGTILRSGGNYAGGRTGSQVVLAAIEGRSGLWCVRVRAKEDAGGGLSQWSDPACVQVTMTPPTTTTTTTTAATTTTIRPTTTTTTAKPSHVVPTLRDSTLKVSLDGNGDPKSVYLRWDGVPEVGLYNVEFSRDGSVAATVNVSGGLDGLRLKTYTLNDRFGRWCARVRAAGNSAGTVSDWSPERCVDVAPPVVEPTPHAAPTWSGSGLTVSSTSDVPTTLTATWSGRAEVDGYRVRFSLDGRTTTTIGVGGGSGVVSQNLNLNGQGGRWCAVVQALADPDQGRTASPWSGEVCRTVTMPEPPDTTPPPNVTPQVRGITHDSATVSWSAVSDPSGIHRYEVMVGGVVVAAVGSSVREHVVTGLLPSTRFAVVVRAVDNAGNVGRGNIYLATTKAKVDTSPPSTVELRIDKVSHDSIRIGWIPAIDDTAVTGYEVSINGTKTMVDPSILGQTFGDLQPNTSYQIVVRARDARSNWGTGIPVSTKTDPPPGPPKIALADWNLHSITMTWTDVPEGTVALAPYLFGHPTSAYITDLSTNTHVFRNLGAYNLYWISLVAIDADGVKLESQRIGRHTDFDDGTGNNTPAPGNDGKGPIWLGGSAGINVPLTTATTATIDWTGAYDYGDDKNASSYRLFVNGAEVGKTDCGLLPAAECSPATSAVLSGLTTGVAHSVVVVAYDIAGNPSGAVNGSNGVVLTKQVTPSGPAGSDPPSGPLPGDPDDPTTPPSNDGVGTVLPDRPTIGFLGPDDTTPPICPNDRTIQIREPRYWNAAKVTVNTTGAYDPHAPGDPHPLGSVGTWTDLVLRRYIALPDSPGAYDVKDVATMRSSTEPHLGKRITSVVRDLDPWTPIGLVLVARDLSGNETYCSSVSFRVPEQSLPQSGEPVCANEEANNAVDLRDACTTYFNRLGTDSLIYFDRIDDLIQKRDLFGIGWTLGCVTLQYLPAIGDFIDLYCAASDLSNLLANDEVQIGTFAFSRETRCAVHRYDGTISSSEFGATTYADVILDWSSKEFQQGGTRLSRRYNLEHYNPICDARPNPAPMLEPRDHLEQVFCPSNPTRQFMILGERFDCADHQG